MFGFAAATRIDASCKQTTPGRTATVLAVLWLVFTAVGFQQLSAPLQGFPGRLVPWFLALFAALAFWGSARLTTLSVLMAPRATSWPRIPSKLMPRGSTYGRGRSSPDAPFSNS